MADEAKKVKGVVDFVFLIDATGSMEPCIEALKENLRVFIDTLVGNKQSPVRDWRGMVFGYRDVEEDGDHAFVLNPFVQNDAEALKAQLARLEAQGGGDEPESLLDAIYRLASMPQSDRGAQTLDPNKWRYRSNGARVVIVFTDASYKDRMAIPEARGGGIDDVINVIHSNRIILSVFAPDLPCYDKLSAADRSEFMPICGPEENPVEAMAAFTADVANFQKTLEQLAKSVSKSAAVEPVEL